MRKTYRIIAALLVCGPLTAQADIITGTITGWPESGPLEVIGDGTNSVSMFWSINTNDRGFFYGSGFTGDSDVAIALGVNDISDIVDAAALTYTSGFVGPVCDADCATNGVGTFLVWNNINTGFYGVLRVDDIIGTGLEATLNATWWFQDDGTGNFAGKTAVPEPATLALLSIGLLGIALLRRRKSA